MQLTALIAAVLAAPAAPVRVLQGTTPRLASSGLPPSRCRPEKRLIWESASQLKSDDDLGDAGHFGAWGHELGLPVFSWKKPDSNTMASFMDHSADKGAGNSPLGGPDWSRTEAAFQFGNDRVVALLSTDGHVQVRADEGGPTVLHDWNPGSSTPQLGGGLGFLTDASSGNLLCGTGSNSSGTDRSFVVGAGYTRRTVDCGRGIRLNQTLLSPFGDDPIVLSLVTISTAASSSPASLEYAEGWSAAPVQLANSQSQQQRRTFQSQFYNTTVKASDDHTVTVLAHALFEGKPCQDCPDDPRQVPPNASFWDERPPTTFFADISTNGSGTVAGCSAVDFWEGGVSKPRLKMACPSPSEKSGDGVLALRKHVTLSAGESITLVFAFGYIPTLEQSLFSREIMLSKYKAAAAVPEQLLVKHAAAWQAAVISLNLTSQHPDAKSATREVTWHSIQHRQMLTKDNFFGEYILSQGTAYQWVGGSQAAARDPLQHLLPLILTDGKKAKSILRYTMKELAPPWAVNATQPNNLPYGLFGHGIMQTAVNRHDGSISQSSDEELYMFYAVTEYLLASRDWAFLNETVVALQHGHGTARTVVECLIDSFSHIKRTGFGPHGLMKLLTGDWNDAMGGYALKSGATVAELMSRGESTCNAAMAAAIIPRLADALGLAQNSGLQIPGGNNTLRSMRQLAKQQAQALRRAWNGEWLSRAWMPVNSSYNPDGWFCTNGEDYRLCLEPQPWAIMATKMGESVLSSAERSTLVQSMENLLHLGAPGTWDVSSAQRGITGAAVASKCWHNGSSGFPCGYHENAGAWYSQNHPLVMALAQENASLAWKEWVANSLFHSARLWPTYWPGIWSAADAYGSSLASFKSGAVGISYFPDMPVFCTHAHAWPLYSMARMAGLTFDHGGLRVNPAVPLEMGDYAFLTPLASVTRQRIVNIGSNGSVTYAYSGEWRPASFVDECVISVDINALHGNSSRVTVEVVGGEQNTSIATGCGPALPLRWRATVDAVGEGRKV